MLELLGGFVEVILVPEHWDCNDILAQEEVLWMYLGGLTLESKLSFLLNTGFLLLERLFLALLMLSPLLFIDLFDRLSLLCLGFL